VGAARTRTHGDRGYRRRARRADVARDAPASRARHRSHRRSVRRHPRRATQRARHRSDPMAARGVTQARRRRTNRSDVESPYVGDRAHLRRRGRHRSRTHPRGLDAVAVPRRRRWVAGTRFARRALPRPCRSAVRSAWRAELYKITTVRGQWIGATLASFAIPLTSLLVVATGGLDAHATATSAAATGSVAGLVAFGAWGATITAGEYATHTMMVSLAIVPRRSVLYGAKLLST